MNVMQSLGRFFTLAKAPTAGMTRTFCVRGYSSLPDDDATGKMEHVKLMLESAIADYQEHMYDFTVKGNKAAGTRARRSLLEMKDATHKMRLAIIESKHNMEKKSD